MSVKHDLSHTKAKMWGVPEFDVEMVIRATEARNNSGVVKTTSISHQYSPPNINGVIE
jgi:hypothetical protein